MSSALGRKGESEKRGEFAGRGSPMAGAGRRRWCSGGRITVPVGIWFVSALLFFFIFRLALRNSTPLSRQNRPLVIPPNPGDAVSNAERRARLYDKMARDLEEKGLAFLSGGQTSQSLSLTDIFTLKDGLVTPVLKAASPPVRANVLYLDPEYSKSVSEVVRDTFLPYFSEAIWFQNSSLYHFSMFHASHHLEPVPATEDKIEMEANAVKVVTEALCPLKITLDRVVLTSTGVLLGCWQVISGSDPATIRAMLRKALPRAPQKQLYDPVMLHTSFARILGHPKISQEGTRKPLDQLQFFRQLVDEVNKRIGGLEAKVSELWFVEEFDVLALALNGRLKARKFHLDCLRS